MDCLQVLEVWLCKNHHLSLALDTIGLEESLLVLEDYFLSISLQNKSHGFVLLRCRVCFFWYVQGGGCRTRDNHGRSLLCSTRWTLLNQGDQEGSLWIRSCYIDALYVGADPVYCMDVSISLRIRRNNSSVTDPGRATQSSSIYRKKNSIIWLTMFFSK